MKKQFFLLLFVLCSLRSEELIEPNPGYSNIAIGYEALQAKAEFDGAREAIRKVRSSIVEAFKAGEFFARLNCDNERIFDDVMYSLETIQDDLSENHRISEFDKVDLMRTINDMRIYLSDTILKIKRKKQIIS